MLTCSQHNQRQATKVIIRLVRADLGTRPADSVRRALYNQYWFDTDIGLDHLLFALYTCWLTKHFPYKRADCDELKALAREYHYGYDVYDFSDECAKTGRGYIFVNETEIVNLLTKSWLSRSCAYIWLSLFCRNKARYGAEVEPGCMHDVVRTNRLRHLLLGVVLADGKMHLPSWHGKPKRSMTVAKWEREWEQDDRIVPADWD